ncbi:DNA-binding transcriptional regulator BolA [Buchnera aphidicola (Phyllaphis fagi)]|uniref:BolA/IbaG family iron-sulfur metabolism protein n=1 Tax=Buchnera aphidicola TaxID=9 RepID=UPI00346429B2
MIKKIKDYFQPKYIKIYDNSVYHTMKDNKKNIIIFIVSNKFIGKTLFKRHKQVHSILSNEINNTIYAISIYTYTIHEWNKKKMNYTNKIICQYQNK